MNDLIYHNLKNNAESMDVETKHYAWQRCVSGVYKCENVEVRIYADFPNDTTKPCSFFGVAGWDHEEWGFIKVYQTDDDAEIHSMDSLLSDMLRGAIDEYIKGYSTTWIEARKLIHWLTDTDWMLK